MLSGLGTGGTERGTERQVDRGIYRQTGTDGQGACYQRNGFRGIKRSAEGR